MRADIHEGPGHNCFNQRPDTLMQDRKAARSTKPLATRGRTIHWVNALDQATLKRPQAPRSRRSGGRGGIDEKDQAAFRSSCDHGRCASNSCRLFLPTQPSRLPWAGGGIQEGRQTWRPRCTKTARMANATGSTPNTATAILNIRSLPVDLKY